MPANSPDCPDAAWFGTIIGLVDHPSVVLEDDAGKRLVLPQRFEYEEAGPAPEESAGPPLPDGGCARLIRRVHRTQILHCPAAARLAELAETCPRCGADSWGAKPPDVRAECTRCQYADGAR